MFKTPPCTHVPTILDRFQLIKKCFMQIAIEYFRQKLHKHDLFFSYAENVWCVYAQFSY